MVGYLRGLGYRQQKPQICSVKVSRWIQHKAALPSALSVTLNGGTEIEAMWQQKFFYVAKFKKALYGYIVANREMHQTDFLIVSFHSGQGF